MQQLQNFLAAEFPVTLVPVQCGLRVHVAPMRRHDHANPYCASVRMRFWIAVSSGAYAHLSNCAHALSFNCAHAHSSRCAHAHSFISCARVHLFVCAHAHLFHVAHAFSHQFEPHHGLLVPCVSIDWRKVAFEAALLFVCGLSVTCLLSVSYALLWSLELANPLIMVMFQAGEP